MEYRNNKNVWQYNAYQSPADGSIETPEL